MSFRHFRLLTWKNYRLKWHHWFITLLEFLLPIGTIALIVYKLPPTKGGAVSFEAFPTIEEGSHQNMEICYSPANPITSGFMEKLRSFPQLNITEASNETELEEYLLQQASPYLIGVHFLKLESSTSTPHKLSYILRKVLINQELYDRPFTFAQFLLNMYFINYTNEGNSQKIEIEKLVQVDIHEFAKIEENIKFEIFAPLIILCITIFMFSIPFMMDILEEKNTGLKELMKITGVSELTICLTWFLYGLFGILISFTVCALLLTMVPMVDSEQTAINYVPFYVLWSFLILYYMANISFCFTLTALFHQSAVVTIMYFFYSALNVGIVAFVSETVTKYVPPYVLCIFPIFAYWVGFKEILAVEYKNIEFSSEIFMTSQNKQLSVPYGLLFIFCVLAFETLLYLILAYIISSIHPGKFGTSKTPFSFFEGFFLGKGDSKNRSISTDSKYFEPPPSNLEPSLQINNLHKRFASLHAVRGVNLITYKGEITALLGHNGAGKTTTLSILTGLISPSAGSVYYNRLDVFKNMSKFRRSIGVCPQENRTFHYLSVMDHLVFFGMLKGASKKRVTNEAEEYLDMIGMSSKKKSKVRELSGGMKRKLCLSIAMMGKAEVLILDEPSSGMDTESRRSLWNLLLDLREGRSIIFTTHHMEEADALGDRIAIMNHGVIVCYGSSMFLKKAYDTGYELTITKSSDNSAAITQVIRSVLPSASVVSDAKQEIVFKLPLTETHLFPALFQSLESYTGQLGIENIGVTATTMEQVFLIAGGATTTQEPSSPKTSMTEVRYRKKTGLGLVSQQLWAIYKKKFLFTIRDLTNIFLRMVLVTVLLCGILKLAEEATSQTPDKPVDLSLSILPGAIVVYDEVNPPISLQDQVEKFVTEKQGVFMNANGTGSTEKMVNESLIFADLQKYQKYLVSGIELNESSTSLIYGKGATFPGLPITIDIYSNALLRKITNSDESSIEAIGHPLAARNPKEFGSGCLKPKTAASQMFLWYLSLGFFTTDLLTYFANFVSMERVDGFYHIQMMSHVSPFVYWLGTLFFDFALFSIFMIIRIVLFSTVNAMIFVGFHEAFLIYVLATTLYGITTLVFIYILSFLMNMKERSLFFFLFFNVVFVIANFLFDQLGKFITVENLGTVLWHVLDAIWKLKYIMPIFTYYTLISNLLVLFIDNSQCLYCAESYKPTCEAKLKKHVYLEFPSEKNPAGLLTLVLTICGETLLYLFILFLLYSGFFDNFFNILKKIVYGTGSTQTDTSDNDVRIEREKVQLQRNIVLTTDYFSDNEDDWVEEEFVGEEPEQGNYSSTNQLPKLRPKQIRRRKKKRSAEDYETDDESQYVSLLVDGLRKNYISWFRKFTAVSDVSFTVERGMCFGLLGVNGAGKTTTFRMLTAEILPSAGDSVINGYKLSKNKAKYLAAAGYCPQTNCFIEQLTGEEMLTIIASMRGVSGRDKTMLVNKWISLIGLKEYRDRRCGSYSGGNKRKLCSAMSLIGDPYVVFLDEPTSGVDPVSRRNLYDVMAQSRESGQTVVLTSHSMEECETLCDKLTIMVSGVMKCIGSAQHLKKRYAQGFSALFKIFDTPEAQDKLSELKETIQKAFSPSPITLKDEHLGLLRYQIGDTQIPWSVLFGIMESIKAYHKDVVEDYVITDTTLEEVFISFAKTQ